MRKKGLVITIVVIILIALITRLLWLVAGIPIAIAGALLLLWLTGNSLNLRAFIGIIVMMGIIINDSILKIDTINRLMKRKIPIMDAIHQGGTRRLKPIIMTSATTILAMVPFLFGDDMGSRLQQPLAITVIGGMTIGTLVSLYFVPLCYYYLVRNKK